ncbi:hypothetical protein NDU88_002806 [Pleurodeles waltl]|uniref:Uncharacterized protein n=1 Tax=Pleurodeles waltl TaxID=8319 RepID=A0AAV7T2Y2_PLEWA|nr:hypothetical protein NDU88_002806 [Pleurodeles waltl]
MVAEGGPEEGFGVNEGGFGVLQKQVAGQEEDVWYKRETSGTSKEPHMQFKSSKLSKGEGQRVLWYVSVGHCPENKLSVASGVGSKKSVGVEGKMSDISKEALPREDDGTAVVADETKENEFTNPSWLIKGMIKVSWPLIPLSPGDTPPAAAIFILTTQFTSAAIGRRPATTGSSEGRSGNPTAARSTRAARHLGQRRRDRAAKRRETTTTRTHTITGITKLRAYLQRDFVPPSRRRILDCSRNSGSGRRHGQERGDGLPGQAGIQAIYLEQGEPPPVFYPQRRISGGTHALNRAARTSVESGPRPLTNSGIALGDRAIKRDATPGSAPEGTSSQRAGGTPSQE